jgi:hypothetical protein
MYWLTNPQHGEMPVYDLADVERHKKWGWTLLNEGSAPLRKKPEAPEVVERKKPGPKPKVK